MNNNRFATKEMVKALFNAYKEADAEYQKAKAVMEQRFAERSECVKQILYTIGNGPFILADGKEVQIVKRDETYFFRSRNGKESVVIN